MTKICLLIFVKSIFCADWDPATNFRLPDTIRPRHYEIDLKPYLDPEDQGEEYNGPDPQHFDGISTAYFTASEETSLLVINSKYLDYKTLVVSEASNVGSEIPVEDYVLHDVDDTYEYLLITLGQPLKPNVEYKLETTYTGYLKNNNYGFYISEYEADGKVHYVASTQMEGPYARRAFPCFDEPIFKATYDIVLWYQTKYPWSKENEYFALSNMPIKDEVSCDDGWCKCTFDTTAKMSSYLTVFAIVDFGSVVTSTILENTPAELFARKELIGEKNQAIDDVAIDNPMWFPARCTERITDKFGEVLRKYSEMGVPKADQIALPDFNAGAMENWGLVTYREQSLLYDITRDRFRKRYNNHNTFAYCDISHEMAHMWFGDFITCPWWDELWINEAFATYISYVGMEESPTPELEWDPVLRVANWDLGLMFITGDITSALKVDQTIRSNPLVNIENNGGLVVDGDASSGASDVTYAKGACVIRMMRCVLGDDAFFGGLQHYLEKFQYANPTTQDLFQSWDEYITTNDVAYDESYESSDNPLCGGIGQSLNSGQSPVLPSSFENTFDPWVRQMGYPFLRVRYTEDGSVGIHQKRFLNNPDENIEDPPSSFNYRWNVPMSLLVKTGDSVKYATQWLLAENEDEEIINLRTSTLTSFLDFNLRYKLPSLPKVVN